MTASFFKTWRAHYFSEEQSFHCFGSVWFHTVLDKNMFCYKCEMSSAIMTKLHERIRWMHRRHLAGICGGELLLNNFMWASYYDWKVYLYCIRRSFGYTVKYCLTVITSSLKALRNHVLWYFRQGGFSSILWHQFLRNGATIFYTKNWRPHVLKTAGVIRQ